MTIDNIKALQEIENFNYNDYEFTQLVSELKVVFKETEPMDIILSALVQIGEIDDKGNSTERAKALLETIMKNKIKDTIKHK